MFERVGWNTAVECIVAEGSFGSIKWSNIVNFIESLQVGDIFHGVIIKGWILFGYLQRRVIRQIDVEHREQIDDRLRPEVLG